MGCIIMQAATTEYQTTNNNYSSTTEEYGSINEMILAGKPWQSGHFLKPMLSELTEEHPARWLTLVVNDEEAPRTIRWLKSSGINNSRVQVLNSAHCDTTRLTCRALASGTSHTVVSWLNSMDEFTLKKLEAAAQRGNCQGLTIRSRYS